MFHSWPSLNFMVSIGNGEFWHDSDKLKSTAVGTLSNQLSGGLVCSSADLEMIEEVELVRLHFAGVSEVVVNDFVHLFLLMFLPIGTILLDYSLLCYLACCVILHMSAVV
ncbi:unnamed protein product [Vicia faba]|uniref:Uncharacterized protein n=1 Tax=Vicia faba TaxID=3906 RepID=A0AAV1B7T2_VICFA|nr:unnamed protein product [Vicia faba]